MRLSILVLCLSQLALIASARASAEPSGARVVSRQPERDVTEQIEDAVQLSLDAEFERALSAFDGLLVSEQLDDETLARVLVERSMVLYALHEEAALDDDLRRLAAVAPDASMSERAPPALSSRWQSVQSAEARTALKSKRASAPTAEAVAQRALPGPHASTLSDPQPPLAPLPSERSLNKRAWWIGGAAVAVVAVVAVSLALTVPGSSSDRTAIKPRVEF